MTTLRAEEKFVTANNLRLRYLEWGTADKPAMVCLHGHTGQAHIWDEFGEAMAPHYHVYAPDQRGHGLSQWATGDYDRLRFVEDLAAFIDVLNLQKVVLVGLSMGGWNSLLYTPDHQNRVERVIIVDIAPEFSEEASQMMANRPPTPLAFSSFDEAVNWARAGNPFATEERLRQDMTDKMRQLDNGLWGWKADAALFNSPLRDSSDPDLISRYWRSVEAISCPILLVRGLGSILVSDEILERLHEANPLFSSVDVADAGHVVPFDKPQEFIAATRSFLGLPR